MERLTKRTKTGVVYTQNAKYGEVEPDEMSYKDREACLEKLAEYENEEEQRELGCDVCNGIKPVYTYPVYISGEQYHEERYIDDTDFKICPYCSKRLGE